MNQVQTHNRRQVRRSVSAESIQVTQENEAEIFAWLRELGYLLIERGRGVNLGCVVFGHHDWATSAVPYGHYLVREAGALTHFTEAGYHERGYATIDDTPAAPTPVTDTAVLAAHDAKVRTEVAQAVEEVLGRWCLGTPVEQMIVAEVRGAMFRAARWQNAE